MQANHPTPENADPRYQPVPAVTNAALGPSDRLQLRRLAKTGGWTRQERLRIAWYRLRLAIQEMNYATRRLAEPQIRLP